jgi:hypothetical protein
LPAAAFQAALSCHADLSTWWAPAESRLQPGLAAPQFVQKAAGAWWDPSL